MKTFLSKTTASLALPIVAYQHNLGVVQNLTAHSMKDARNLESILIAEWIFLIGFLWRRSKTSPLKTANLHLLLGIS
jgi:hypothetical protein